LHSCQYITGWSSDKNKAYGIAYTDGGTVGYSQIYVMLVDMGTKTIKYYDCQTKFNDDDLDIRDALIPQSSNYAYFAAGMDTYIGISGGGFIY
jgi:hypothetical protein